MTLSQLTLWVKEVPESLPIEMRPMAFAICESFQTAAKRLMDLGLGYLTLDRAASTLSTGERQDVYKRQLYERSADSGNLLRHADDAFHERRRRAFVQQ